MLIPISQPMIKLAQVIIKKLETGLDPEDIAILKNDGPGYMRQVQTNLKLGKKPLTDLPDSAKKVLLSYVIFLRQNITIEKGDKPNEEDAAKVIHGEVFENSDKAKKDLEEELLKQMEKIGIDVRKNDKGDE
jgi:hypothetical protein